MPKVLTRFANYLSSKSFYRLVLIVFLFEAVWIALSAAYPQAFDENFHFGLIKVYSHYWLPFLSHQPKGADAFGAVARDPSYLYHYLMSFPYRIIELFTKSQTAQVIALRFINIGLFAWGIVLFRKILLRVGSSKALSNLILMLFILIPIVPQLAAQINYDNLIIPLTAVSVLLSFRIMDEIKEHKTSIRSVALLISVCLIATLVKYAFLPIFAAIAVFLAVLSYKANKHKLKNFFTQLMASWREQKWLAKTLIILALAIPLVLFAQRDVVNVIKYHAIEPDCAKVLSVKQCMAYSPWAYNYTNHQHIAGSGIVFNNPIVYGFQWIYWMWYRLFFAVNGPNSGFTNYPPLPLPSAASLILLIVGVVALVKWWRKIFKGNLRMVFLSVVTIAYVIALFGQGYYTYRYTDVLENMNGRYLLPVLILVAAVFGQALSYMFRKAETKKAAFALVALLFFLEGGGLITFIARSDSTWDVDNKAVVKVNNTARKVIKKVVVKGKVNYDTSLWFFN